MFSDDQQGAPKCRFVIVPLFAIGLMVGCRGGEVTNPSTEASFSSSSREATADRSAADESPERASYIATVSADMRAIVEAALDDAAKRTGRARSTLVVVSSEAVTWPDGGLGCPEPGVTYTMALVPGYRVFIRAGDELLDYHASRRGYLLYCPAGRSIDPVPSGAT